MEWNEIGLSDLLSDKLIEICCTTCCCATYYVPILYVNLLRFLYIFIGIYLYLRNHRLWPEELRNRF